MSFFTRLHILFSRDLYIAHTVPEFAHQNKNMLIIVCDPKSDKIFVSYKDRHVVGRIKGVDGRKSKIVKEVLKYSRFDATIDQYITAIMETLHLPLWRANQFYQFIDGAVFNIAKSLRKSSKPRKDGLVPSPLSMDDIGRVDSTL